MNFKNVGCLTAAIAAVLGSSSAFAVLPPSQGGPAAPDFVFYYGGGSAEPQPVQAAFCRLMNNVDSYTDTAVANPSTDGGSYRILYGTTNAAIGAIPVNKNVMIMYKLNGGSYTNGGLPQTVAPPNANAFLPYPTVATVLAGTTAATGPAGNNGQACNLVNKGTPTQSYAATKGNATVTQAPDFGLTDLEVGAFSGFNNPTNGPLAPVGAAAPIYDLVFGIAATNALYAQKHNFSTAEIAGLISGQISDWSQLYGDQGTFANAPLPAGPVVLIDRNVGSGHKTQSAAQFLGFPGLGSNAQFPQSVSGANGGLGGVNCVGNQVTFNTGYTNAQPANAAPACPTLPVQVCGGYQDVFTSSAANTVNALLFTQACAAPSNRAVGILSMDNPPSQHGNLYSFVAIDNTNVDTGVSPGDSINAASGGHTSYINAIKGNYTDFYQANFNTRTGFLGSTSVNVDMAKAMEAQFQSPSLTGCASAKAFPQATPGILIDADNAAALPATGGVTLVSRGGNSDSLIPSVVNLPGNVVACADPL